MCTLIVIHQRLPGVPLVVAANRDEFYDRPAAGPAIWTHPDGNPILAPRDLLAGGTWLGLNQSGVFAALTNRPMETPDPTRRSRGLLVLDALGYATAAKAAAAFESLRADQHNTFNLFFADKRDAFVVVSHDGEIRVDRLAPGTHVIGNAEPNDPHHEKTQQIVRAAAGLDSCAGSGDVLDGLADVCRSHVGADGTTGPLGAPCVHLSTEDQSKKEDSRSQSQLPTTKPHPQFQDRGYGTRCSILLKHSDAPEESKFLYADGAPCAHPYVDSTPLLTELSQAASYTAEGPTTRTIT
ncbi:MAG: hypothetical protein ACI8W3_000581 [Myxococcota bacterium]|jgi:hypothetical protein